MKYYAFYVIVKTDGNGDEYFMRRSYSRLGDAKRRVLKLQNAGLDITTIKIKKYLAGTGTVVVEGHKILE
jgi:hypothetical protein